MVKKTIVIAGQQGERGDSTDVVSVPIDGVLGYTESDTPEGYVDTGIFSVSDSLKEVDSRLDVIEALPEGSTSGDAEVADIRVGYDGEIYESAGDAVRGQIGDLHTYSESIDDVQDAQIETMEVKATAEGQYITLQDAASLPAHSYSLTLSPVQDLNGYEYPWAAGAGNNKFDGEIEQGALNPSNGENTPNTQRYRSKNYIPVKPNTTYKISVDGTATSANILSYGSDKSFLSDVDKPYANQITTSANAYYLRFFGTDSLNSTKVQIEEGQTATAWTPYSNICPIHGADEVGVRECGKNLYDKNNGVLYGYPTGSYKWQQAASSSNELSICVKLIEGKTYTATRVAGANSYFRIQSSPTYPLVNGQDLVDIDSTGGLSVNEKTFTVPTGSPYVIFYVRNISNSSDLTVEQVENGFMVEVGSQATDYEPYTLHSTTITLPSTVYGGSVEMGGSGSVTYDEVDLGSINWNYSSTNQVFYGDIPIKVHALGEMSHLLASCYATATIGYAANMTDKTIMQSYEIGRIYIKDTAYTDAQVFKTAVTGQQLVYEMATPETLSVTPFPQTLLEGVNNLWAEMSESGDVIGDADQEITYQRDTTLVIKNLINRIEELERRNA